jgi:hypothetical protein
MNRYNQRAENRWRNRQNEFNENSNSNEHYVYKLSVRLAHMYPDIDRNELYDNLLKIHKEIGEYNWASEVSNNNRTHAATNNNNGYNGNNNRTVVHENNRNTYPGNENQSVGGRRNTRRKTRKNCRK